MGEFLRSCDVIDAAHPDVVACARGLGGKGANEIHVARACFEFVRDEVRHSVDYRCGPVTCRASDVLKHRTGYCYAKSHLLAALLRARGIPAGLCYQRLALDEHGTAFCLHGFNAVHLKEFGWYRMDARGNKPGVAAEFDPPRERLAFPLVVPGEVEFAEVLAEPLPVVRGALERHADWEALLGDLPDVMPSRYAECVLSVRAEPRGG